MTQGKQRSIGMLLIGLWSAAAALGQGGAIFSDGFEHGNLSQWSRQEGWLWAPEPLTRWQWQLTGTIDTSVDVAMYDIDLFDTPQSVIDGLKADGG